MVVRGDKGTYFDQATRTNKVALDFATEKAIIQMCAATALAETGMDVAQGEVTTAGIWRPDLSRP